MLSTKKINKKLVVSAILTVFILLITIIPASACGNRGRGRYGYCHRYCYRYGWCKNKAFIHGIELEIDGEMYYIDGPADGTDGAKDMPGHYWKITSDGALKGRTFNVGPFDEPKYWSKDTWNWKLLYIVHAVVDTWSPEKAETYSDDGFVHYQKLARVSDGIIHPYKIVWMKHIAIWWFTFDGEPHDIDSYWVRPGIDYNFLPNAFDPYGTPM